MDSHSATSVTKNLPSSLQPKSTTCFHRHTESRNTQQNGTDAIEINDNANQDQILQTPDEPRQLEPHVSIPEPQSQDIQSQVELELTTTKNVDSVVDTNGNSNVNIPKHKLKPSSFNRDLFKLTPHLKQFEFYAYPVTKKEAKQRSNKCVNGTQTPASNNNVKPKVVQNGGNQPNQDGRKGRKQSQRLRPLEEYVKGQTAAFLERRQENVMDKEGTDDDESTSSSDNFPLMLQGLSSSWSTEEDNPEAQTQDMEVIYSVDKSALTINLDQLETPSIKDTSLLWPKGEEEEILKPVQKSSEEFIASFVLSDNTIGKLNAPRISSAETTVFGPDGQIHRPKSAWKAYDVQHSTKIKEYKEFLDDVQNLIQILMDSIIVNREALDILTFPLSHDFEPFGRFKGAFFVLSQIGRIIKSIDLQLDTDSLVTFALKELELFRGIVQQFATESLELIREIQIGLRKKMKKLLDVLINLARKSKDVKSQFNENSSIPIYTTKLDPLTITYFEKFSGSTFFDYNATSIELLWTPTLTYFKGFKQRNWHCLQVENPQLQIKIILSLVKLCRKILIEVKYILEEEAETINSHLSYAVHKIYKTLKQRQAYGQGGGIAYVTSAHEKLQSLFDLNNTLQNYLYWLESGFHCIYEIVPGIHKMAGLRQEEMEDLMERVKYKGIFKGTCFSGVSCQQKLAHSFYFSDFKFILLRIPLQNDVMYKLLQGIQDRPTWNTHAGNVLQVMCEAQAQQFKEKREDEFQNYMGEKSRDKKRSPLTVYNVGHIFVHLVTSSNE